MHFAFGLHRCLAQECSALGELGVQLIVEVDSVRHDHDGGAVQCLLQQVSVEYHGQRFAAALCMPEHATFTIALGGDFCFFHGLANSEVLVVSRQYLERFCLLHGEADEVLYNIQQTRSVEHALVEGVELCVCGIFVAAVFGFPLHESVEARGDGACLISGKVTDHADGVVIENGRDVLHVVADLVVCVFCVNLILGRAFQLHEYQRQTVDEQDDIGASVVAVLNVCKLIDYIEAVIGYGLVVDQIHD